MKIIAYNSNLIFKAFGMPERWDYDVLGTFVGGADAWSHNPGSDPIYFLQPGQSGMDLYYKPDSGTSATDADMQNGDILRLFAGDVFLRNSNGNLSIITELEKEASATLTTGKSYKYSDGRISTTASDETGWKCAAISVSEGDVVVYRGVGGNNSRLFGWQDATTCDVQPASASTGGNYFLYQAPGTGTVYFNSIYSGGTDPDIYVLRQPES